MRSATASAVFMAIASAFLLYGLNYDTRAHRGARAVGRARRRGGARRYRRVESRARASRPARSHRALGPRPGPAARRPKISLLATLPRKTSSQVRRGAGCGGTSPWTRECCARAPTAGETQWTCMDGNCDCGRSLSAPRWRSAFLLLPGQLARLAARDDGGLDACGGRARRRQLSRVPTSSTATAGFLRPTSKRQSLFADPSVVLDRNEVVEKLSGDFSRSRPVAAAAQPLRQIAPLRVDPPRTVAQDGAARA